MVARFAPRRATILQEQLIPPAALRDPNSVEMLRVWIAERELHCSLRVGMFSEATKLEEERSWGIMISDLIRHLADAIHAAHGTDKDEVIRRILGGMTVEIREPTAPPVDSYVEKDDLNWRPAALVPRGLG
jgi:uncharacterized protein DUF5076